MNMKRKDGNNETKECITLHRGGGPAEPVLSKAWAGCRTMKMRRALSAFTMAEILLSLTIIGVVAAITLPSLTGNINERTWNTQRKALYARFSQAIALMPSLNGYGTLKEASSSGASDAVDTAAETFVTNGLSKVLKINNICDNDHLEDCGITSKYVTMLGSTSALPKTLKELNPEILSASYSYNAAAHGSHSMLNTKAAAFETANGESIVVYYNPNCTSNMGLNGFTFTQPYFCANFIYDLNGQKGPNTVGKDMGFMTALYSSDSVIVAPMPYTRMLENVDSAEASNACTTQAGEEYRIPTLDETVSLFVNRYFNGVDYKSTYLFSSTKGLDSNDDISNWLMLADFGEWRLAAHGAAWSVLCVKR